MAKSLYGEDPRGTRRGAKGSGGTPGPLELAAQSRAEDVVQDALGALLAVRTLAVRDVVADVAPLDVQACRGHPEPEVLTSLSC